MKIESLKKFIRTKKAQDFLDKSNISSLGIGYKIKDGKQTDEICIQFTVDQKIEPEFLEAIGTPEIPEDFTVDGEKVKTDIIQRKYSPKYEIIREDIKTNRKAKLDPIVPGISISHHEETAGTLGCIVYDSETGEEYILSNWHVLHGAEGEIGDIIVQPGPFDDNSAIELNKMGKLVRSHLGLAGDCAISTIENRDIDPEILDIGIIPKQIARVELGDKVVKSGRTTDVTYGIVIRIEVTINLNYGGDIGSRKIGCFEIGPDPEKPAENNEISMGGDSGSIWLLREKDTPEPTDVVVGLHFAGESQFNPDEYALACNIHSVLKKLNVTFREPEEILREREEILRNGYDPDFLGPQYSVPFPALIGQAHQDVLEVNGSKKIAYYHFTVVMNRKRRMAIYTAHNVDGMRIKKVPGVGWKFDDRIDEDFQIGNEAYVDNPWDRGHLVRRAAIVWGSLAEARKANSDSYHYTNATPQHRNFNQDEWVYLEDWVLDQANEDNYKLCVFTGPVFTRRDERYRGIMIPAAYWKIIAMEKNPEKTLSVTAFLMNQYELLHDRNGRRFLNLRLYQVSVETIEDLTDLSFEALRPVQPQTIKETLIVPEGAEPEPWSIISSPKDLFI